ncbi:hypothetical protein CEXT_692801 [Caerostris extrusa]|uniref:Uncharacterized protein n=1 Tax=Caerostris extrusa TaxID=172846 RepID=A0AAV4NYZ7_CAEEX|nr:hypothetical protein CEXT_692801 [Caerostris extrusa]
MSANLFSFLRRLKRLPFLPEDDKYRRNQKNQHLTCVIEERVPFMSVIGLESKEAEMKWIRSLALIPTRYPRREEKKQEARVMKDIGFMSKQFFIM